MIRWLGCQKMGYRQRPCVQGTLLQQSEEAVQVWPYSAHVGGASTVGASAGGASGTLPSGTSASGGGTPPSCGMLPHVPLVEPGGATQGRPGQQSASVVQSPPAGTHVLLPQMNGGSPLPAFLFGTHARPQQSALLAQGLPSNEPASAQLPAPVHRGMPSRSCWHTVGSLFTLPAQQLFSALHDPVASLHTAPAARHALPLSQRPTGSPGVLLHVTDPFPPGMPCEPQQSESVWQISPVGRHPLGGWQISTPVGP